VNKTLIIVVGPNHSGTSAVTKLIMDNGANTGELWDEPQLGYCKYEDSLFKRFCMHRIGMPCERPDVSSNQLSEHIKELGNFVVMKYPKAIFIIEYIKSIAKFLEYDLKVVCTLRNPWTTVESASNKAGNDPNREFFHYGTVWDAATKYAGDIYYVVLERLFYDQEYIKDFLRRLLEEPSRESLGGQWNISALNAGMLKHHVPHWTLFDIKGGGE
jgi:hypothetical protein